MAFKAYQLTLSGVAQRLSDVYGVGGSDVSVAFVSADIPYRQLSFQGLLANTNPIYIGSTPTVSSTIHGIRIGSADTDAPFVMGHFDDGPMKLSDYYVIGTAGEVLLVGGIPY